MSIQKILPAALFISVGLASLPVAAHAATITFPVLGQSSYSNDYDAPRSNGKHNATDIIADKHQKIVSATAGKVTFVPFPQPEWGYSVTVLGDDGMCYWYLHLNNDNPGTDDGKGGAMKAYAPDMKAGNRIKRGQHIGFVGDSGNSEGTVSHLHFEIVKAKNGQCNSTEGTHQNPYNLLRNDSSRISKPIIHPALTDEILPYGGAYKRKVNVARADVTGDGKEDLITGAEGSGSSPKVHVYNPLTKTRLGNFYSLSKSLNHGVDVAAGDVDGDGKNEVITAVRASSSAKIGIYRYDRSVSNRFEKVREFVAYGGSSTSKTIPRVTVGDIDGDGKDEIITGTGSGSASLIRAFSVDGKTIKSHRPFTKTFTGGIDVASGNIANLPSTDEIAVAPLTQGSSRTAIYDASKSGLSLSKIREFYAYGSSYRGGIRLSIGDVDRRNAGFEIATAPNSGARSLFRAKSPTGGTLNESTVLEDWWLGYYDVAASRDGTSEYSFGTGGNRRGSVR